MGWGGGSDCDSQGGGLAHVVQQSMLVMSGVGVTLDYSSDVSHKHINNPPNVRHSTVKNLWDCKFIALPVVSSNHPWLRH